MNAALSSSVLLTSADAELARAAASCDAGDIDASIIHLETAWLSTSLAAEDDERAIGDEISIVEARHRIARFVVSTWAPAQLRTGVPDAMRDGILRFVLQMINYLESAGEEWGVITPEARAQYAKAREQVWAMMVVAPHRTSASFTGKWN
jgi:hypothetical protein